MATSNPTRLFPARAGYKTTIFTRQPSISPASHQHNWISQPFTIQLYPTAKAIFAHLVERLKPFDLISTVRERTSFPGSLLRQLPNLKFLLATGTQFETFDLATAKDLGITVAAAPGGAHPTTQHTWALILALARNIASDDAFLKSGQGWQSGLATGLTGLTLGVVGLGRLGAAVARIAHLAWGMKVVCWSENLTQEKADRAARDAGLSLGDGDANVFRAVSKDELFRSADVISLHYVLSDRSRGLVAARELELMKNSALLVNTSRGPLIDQQALLDALECGRIRGAALDVYDIEPLPVTSPWRRLDYWGRDGRSMLVTTPPYGLRRRRPDECLVRRDGRECRALALWKGHIASPGLIHARQKHLLVLFYLIDSASVFLPFQHLVSADAAAAPFFLFRSASRTRRSSLQRGPYRVTTYSMGLKTALSSPTKVYAQPTPIA
ncbi:uncharacterized protein PG998_008874 [Apiospora kogelbergensis]|uniref:uncharacterized protein n=1 Tax=Apiospora kogelbergensis TaxID=1337665 RepID=UPI003130EBE6